MKKHLFLMMIAAVAIAVSGYAQTTPRYAASTKTWTFGSQTWSDAIRIPACNKTSFTESNTEPHCRSYTEGTHTWYYYNWPYVNQNASALCPSPWRVLSRSDFSTLVNNTNSSTLISEWGYGGYAYSTSVTNTGSEARYWSSTETDNSYAYGLYFKSSGAVDPQYNHSKYRGFQVRCVKKM
jgi:hypothetical protein